MKALCFHSPKLRTIYLAGDVTQKMAVDFRYAFGLLLARNNDPITVEINSEGGDMDAGFLMTDTIRSSPVKVTTIATGAAMSSAALILAAGHHRKATKHSNIMVHQGSYKLHGNFNEIRKGEIPLVLRAEDTFNKLFASFSGRSVDFWVERWKESNVYLSPSEAMELGLIDEIVEWRSPEVR